MLHMWAASENIAGSMTVMNIVTSELWVLSNWTWLWRFVKVDSVQLQGGLWPAWCKPRLELNCYCCGGKVLWIKLRECGTQPTSKIHVLLPTFGCLYHNFSQLSKSWLKQKSTSWNVQFSFQMWSSPPMFQLVPRVAYRGRIFLFKRGLHFV